MTLDDLERVFQCACVYGLRSLPRSVYSAKNCNRVFLVGKFLFVSSDTFAVICIV